MKESSLTKLQGNIRHLISRRFKISLFITIQKLALHLVQTNQDQSGLFAISTDYKRYNYTLIDKNMYENFWLRLENLRKKHGGYHSLIFYHSRDISLINTQKMWEVFMHTCFTVTEYVPCDGNYLIPQFHIDDNITDYNFNTMLSLKWRGHRLKGQFVKDPQHMMSYFPLLKDNVEFLMKCFVYEKHQKEWFHNDIIPFYVSKTSASSAIMKDSHNHLFDLYNSYMNKSISTITREFTECSLHEKYFLIFMFSTGDDKRIFICMLLYTIVWKESEVHANQIFERLPFKTRKILKDRLNLTEEKLSDLYNENDDKSHEIKICSMDAPNNVKRIAIEKLREIQSKPADVTKPQLFLDKLLNIPFGIFKIEPQFKILKIFLGRVQCYSREMQPSSVLYPKSWVELTDFFCINNELNILNYDKKNDIIPLIRSTKRILGLTQLRYMKDDVKCKISLSKSNIDIRYTELTDFLQTIDSDKISNISTEIRKLLIDTEYVSLHDNWNEIKSQVHDVQDHINTTLSNAVYGQKRAKRAIEQIICEWITGDIQGYCFGFEGPPGVGKTTLAKDGLSNCLLDGDHTNRPFSLIALGGASHGSLLEGHGYTYSSSTCGKIVNTLITANCMNPIIFFDELDKVSKTPQGQEITNILVHLTDPSQNKSFMDKYFDGIEIDLSRALFIFSYNDSSQVDPILLDRIHTIPFQSFNTKEKIVICNQYILPTLFKTLGILPTTIKMPDKLIETLIEEFTRESGVRKIKQLLSTMLRELNIRILNGEIKVPIILTYDYVIQDLIQDCRPIKHKTILNYPREGTVAGLFAIKSGGGGIIHIEIKRSQGKSNIEMTGNLGNIMKESIKVAYTAIFNVLSSTFLKDNQNVQDTSLHIHAAEGAVPKDGPSAGVAIALAIISCISNIPINNTIAFTGEIDLNGAITAVGGISDKLRGAYLAGIKKVFCPNENRYDVDKIDIENNDWLNSIEVKYVNYILDEQLLKESFVEDVSKIFVKPRSASF